MQVPPPAEVDYGFQFIPFELEDLIGAPKAAPPIPPIPSPDAIDYSPLHRAVRRDRGWYR